jgi:hypothetical protein
VEPGRIVAISDVGLKTKLGVYATRPFCIVNL